MADLTLVFVHGYSVTNLNTYGHLPQRLINEGQVRGLSIKVQDLYLGRYISFNDEIRISDIAKAFHVAVKEQIPQGSSFICITHSTGAPLIRTWLHLYYSQANSEHCPISHLIMLAPANHGSSLAQLGKGRLSRIKSWFEQVEPGQKILDWLELGSEEAWELNSEWIRKEASDLLKKSVFPFVISGQDIDRKMYDHLNSYTGEAGSDGVVRLASANLNSRYLKLEQSQNISTHTDHPYNLELTEFVESPPTAFKVLSRKSHSGDKMGIMKSVNADINDTNSVELINAIFSCLSVQSAQTYNELCKQFESECIITQKELGVEIDNGVLLDRHFIHDRYAMVIFRICDNEKNPLSNYDLILCSGPGDDPDNLPKGFLADRQRNNINSSNLTYYFNYDLLIGTEEIRYNGELLRRASKGIDSIGLCLYPRPDTGFVKYTACRINVSKDLFQKMFKANSTTLVDICLQRFISPQIFRFEKTETNASLDISFKDTEAGDKSIS